MKKLNKIFRILVNHAVTVQEIYVKSQYPILKFDPVSMECLSAVCGEKIAFFANIYKEKLAKHFLHAPHIGNIRLYHLVR